MAIVQISQITARKGLAIDLPQLAGAEFGWSIDTRQLFIGNGTLAEGAPVIGNTEILTEFSDILNISSAYTYKGTAAGYIVQTGPTSGDPVVQSLQSWMDQFASVKDFGATGDGVTDDTDAINRALYQLYCRQTNPQIRRSLFFPAGVYIISNTINIPPYATLYGEGPENSIIQLQPNSGEVQYVARTADSLQQTGVNIGNGSAITPTDVTISNIALTTADPTSSIFLLDSVTNSKFQGVSFSGPGTTETLDVSTAGTCGVTVFASENLVTKNVVFDKCSFSGLTYGVQIDQPVQSLTFTNGTFDTLYQGMALGVTPVSGGPTGIRVTNNKFDNIYSNGVVLGAISLNATGYNIFYDVANGFAGAASPIAPVILFQGNNNISVGDMFLRSMANSTTWKQVELGTTQSIATSNGTQLSMGSFTRNTGITQTLSNSGSNATIFTFDTNYYGPSFQMEYSIIRGVGHRTGVMYVSSLTQGSPGALSTQDEYSENQDILLTLRATQVGTVVTVSYTADPSYSAVPTIKYSIKYFL